MPLSSQQYQSLRDINMTVNSLSIAGELFVIGVYLFGESLRSYPLRLVCYMAVSNLLLSITYVWSVVYKQGVVCTVQVLTVLQQGFFINFAQLSSLVWTMVFSFCLLISIRERNDQKEEPAPLQSHEWKFLLVGYGAPLLLSVVPIIGGVYTETMYYCWIGFTNEPWNIGEQLLEFYLPLLATVVFNLYATICIRQFQKQHDDGSESALRYLGRLYVYPLILIACWSPKLITRTLMFADIELFWLDTVDIVCGGLLGLANSVAYGTNRAVIHKIRNIQCCFGERDYRLSMHNSIELAEKEGPYRTKSKSFNLCDSYTKMTGVDRKFSIEV